MSFHLFNPELEDNPVNRERLRKGKCKVKCSHEHYGKSINIDR